MYADSWMLVRSKGGLGYSYVSGLCGYEGRRSRMLSVIDCRFSTLFSCGVKREKGKRGVLVEEGVEKHRDAEGTVKLLHHYRLSNYIIKAQWYQSHLTSSRHYILN